jgi:hypothetical protein
LPWWTPNCNFLFSAIVAGIMIAMMLSNHL